MRTSSWKRSSASTAALRSGSFSSDLPRSAPGPLGTFFASASTSFSGTSSTRPTSRITARAAMVPNVTIWLTRSRPPYFSWT